MIKPEGKKQIVVEDLLRLKRAERPPPEFWGRFERELRAKQLSALLVRRPWWQRLPSVAPFFVRHRILIGASAVIAVSVVSLRTSRPSDPTVTPTTGVTAYLSPVGSGAPTPAADLPVAVMDRVLALSVGAYAAASTNIIISDGGGFAAARVAEPVLASGPQAKPDGALTREPAASPVPHFVTTDLVASLPLDSDAPRLSGMHTGFESRPMVARTRIEPLQQMTPPSDTRRTRLQTAMVSTASFETPTRTTERVASRIDAERLYEQISRFGARGDRLNVKF